MDFSKLGNGAKITLISGLVLIISSFLPWYGAGPFSINGWDSQALAIFGILFGIAAAVVFALKVFEVTDLAIGPFKAEQLTFMLGILSLLFVLLRLITENNGLKYGIFIALISAAGLTFGAFTAIREAGMDLPDMDDFRSFGGGTGGGGNEPPPPPPSE